MDYRKFKGLQIAKTGKIRKLVNSWLVPSESRGTFYSVKLVGDTQVCDCADFDLRQQKCKHIWSVELYQKRIVKKDEMEKIEKMAKPSAPQNWHAYNLAQTKEQEMFMKLLTDLCVDIEESLYSFGRPKLSAREMVFSSALKVYSTFSLRRFVGDMQIALDRGYIAHKCAFSSVSNYMMDEKLTPVIQHLITLSAMPLKSVETKFAIDSSGFRTTKFSEYCREKHAMDVEHQWIKAHICCGVKTNIITAVEVGVANNNKSGDSPQFIPLAKQTHDAGFNIQEMSADKAYSGRDNLAYIDEIGAIPFIPFRKGTGGQPKGNHIWRKMFNYFAYNRDEFLQHYHQRSNVESTFNMIKSKFTDLIRSKNETAQLNELLLKVLCHNIVVLIHEMYELGIEPSFISK